MTTLPTRWPATDPARIQLYSLPTPNGKKASIMLEETGLPYDPHLINIMKGDQHDPEFVAINPNSKIPAIIDPLGPGGEPLAIMESGAILIYLARKAGMLLPTDPRAESAVLQWLFFQVGSVGPMVGQYGHFYKYARGKTDSYGEERYRKETIRLLGVLNAALDGSEWIAGDYSIADIALAPWVGAFDFYECHDAVEYERFTHVHGWMERFHARPAVQRGSVIPSMD